MDKLRDQSNEAVDEMFSKIKPGVLLNASKDERVKLFKMLYLNYLKQNAGLFMKAKDEGKKLGESLNA